MGLKANFVVDGATCWMCSDEIQMYIKCLDQAVLPFLQLTMQLYKL